MLENKSPRSCLRLPLRLPTQVGAAGQEDAGVRPRARKSVFVVPVVTHNKNISSY